MYRQSGPRFCDRCLALQGKDAEDNPPLDYRNVGPTSAWDLTEISDSTYRRMDQLSPWAGLPGFHFHLITHDFMHHVYLGTARDLCGSGDLMATLKKQCDLLSLKSVTKDEMLHKMRMVFSNPPSEIFRCSTQEFSF